MEFVSIDIVRWFSTSACVGLIAAMALLALRLMRCESAGLRYSLASVVMIAMLLVPLAAAPLEVSVPFFDTQVVVTQVSQQGMSGNSVQVIAEQARWLGWIQFSLIVIWGAGAVATLIYYSSHVFRYSSFRIQVDEQATTYLRKQLLRSQSDWIVKNQHRFIVSKKARTAFVAGPLRGRIVFPLQATHWSRRTLETVCYHELQHLKSWDLLRSLLTCLLVSIHWYNPLVWRFASFLFAERERACDERVVRALRLDSVTYFEQVLNAASSIAEPRPVPTIGQRDRLIERIDWLTKPKPLEARKRVRFPVCVLITLIAILPWCAVRQAPIDVEVNTVQSVVGSESRLDLTVDGS